MPTRMSLSAEQARLVHLGAQGLLAPPPRPATRADLRRCLARMGVLQIDSIQVVARSPYLVLFSRLGPYPPAWLEHLLASAAIFECWAHEACFAPIEDYGIHRRSLETRRHWFVDRARRLARRNRKAMGALLERVRAEGPLMASDFASSRPGRSGWWSWGKEKTWLEAWLVLGELMVARRENFQRVYDLRERVHPAGATLALPSPAAAERALLERSILALGVTQARWIHDYFRTRPRRREADLEPLLRDGTVVEVAVEGWKAPGFLHRENSKMARRIASGALEAAHSTLLSPFDPVVWDRERAATMFGFDYRLECYPPAARRRHGYYVLPVLRRGELVGRLDAKAHRAEGLFEVKELRLEAGRKASEALLADLARAISSCAAWHGTPRVRIRAALPVRLRRALAALLAARPA